MQYSVLFLAALAATTTLAAPTKGSKTDCAKPAAELRVEFNNPGTELATQETFKPGQREETVVRNPGPYTKVELLVGDPEKKGDNRCQLLALGEGCTVIPAKRDSIECSTFRDDGLGPWTFKETMVGKLICNEALEVACTAPVAPVGR
ncbi:MAG: hypothetical protein Q9185_006036 [Variospora sp. 1 TL-2023]